MKTTTVYWIYGPPGVGKTTLLGKLLYFVWKDDVCVISADRFALSNHQKLLAIGCLWRVPVISMLYPDSSSHRLADFSVVLADGGPSPPPIVLIEQTTVVPCYVDDIRNGYLAHSTAHQSVHSGDQLVFLTHAEHVSRDQNEWTVSKTVAEGLRSNRLPEATILGLSTGPVIPTDIHLLLPFPFRGIER